MGRVVKKNSTKKKSIKGSGLENTVDSYWPNSTPLNTPLSGVFDMGMGGGQVAPLSTPWELIYNNSYYFVSLNRVVCTYAYTMHGVLRTLVDQPVYDAFRGGLILKSDELDPDEVELLTKELNKKGDIKAVVDALRWDRLFGGAGLIINTEDDFKGKFNKETITKKSELQFITADRWELVMNNLPGKIELGMSNQFYDEADATFDYYGNIVNSSRVLRIIGEEAPSLARRRLAGWGMSVIECVLREINTYLKNQNVLFELLDEAKIDVYKIKDFNSKILSQLAQGQVHKRVAITNWIKNFSNAIMMDTEDDYEQKQLTLTGVADTLVQIRIGIAAAVRMPLTKLFGLSAAGFSSGEDDIENYNSIVEGVRERAREVLDVVIPLRARQLFGYEPEIEYEWKPLRILSSVDEENVKNSKFNRLSMLYSQGMLNGQEYAEAMKAEGVFTMETNVAKGSIEPIPPEGTSLRVDQPQQMAAPKKVTEAA